MQRGNFFRGERRRRLRWLCTQSFPSFPKKIHIITRKSWKDRQTWNSSPVKKIRAYSSAQMDRWRPRRRFPIFGKKESVGKRPKVKKRIPLSISWNAEILSHASLLSAATLPFPDLLAKLLCFCCISRYTTFSFVGSEGLCFARKGKEKCQNWRGRRIFA